MSEVFVKRGIPVSGRAGSRGVAAVFVAVCLLVPVLAAPAVGAQAVSESGPSVGDVELRDGLIAEQEALLNVYRCMFDTDTEVVPGGCDGGAPAQDAQTPPPFEGDPTAAAVELRDGLITQQEALLNVYRCLFDIDTELVPGGCADTAQAPESDQYSAVSLNISGYFAGGAYHCATNSQDTIECSIDGVQVDSPSEPLTDLTVHEYFQSDHVGTIAVLVCGNRANQTFACWTWDWGRDDEGNQLWPLIELDAPFTGTDVAIVTVGMLAGDGTAYETVFCGWRADQSIDCWTLNTRWEYIAWNMGGSLVDDGEITWSPVDLDMPDESFDNMSYADNRFCGWQDDLPADRTCWSWGLERDDDHSLVWSMEPIFVDP
ncbi:hypothetical protein [Candidatus Poriferisocius sp.]|uniref:hypothetical protein n=1 Tax=Candidatus Poriferisocius sp. TaxID=3101276 RepID=UPI003B52714F